MITYRGDMLRRVNRRELRREWWMRNSDAVWTVGLLIGVGVYLVWMGVW